MFAKHLLVFGAGKESALVTCFTLQIALTMSGAVQYVLKGIGGYFRRDMHKRLAKYGAI